MKQDSERATRSESIREAVLELLARHPERKMDTAVIGRLVEPALPLDAPLDEHEILRACALLEGLGLVKSEVNFLGSRVSYQATAAGVLYHERQTR